MRKDMFLGMTIGGGLLAVIIGYLIFHSGSKHAGQTADTDAGKSQQETGEPGITPGPDGEKGGGPAGDNKPANLMAVNDKVWGPLLDGKPVITTPGVNGVTDTPGGGTKPTGTSTTGDGQGSPTDPLGLNHNAAGKARTHKVAQGETFMTIAAAAYGNSKMYRVIVNANPTVNPNRLKPGTEIILPDPASVKTADAPAKATDAPAIGLTSFHKSAEATLDPKTEYRVAQGDSLHKISMKVYGKITMVDKIYELNKGVIGADPAKLKLGTVLKLPTAPVASVH